MDSLRFVIINDNFCIEDTPLKGKYKVNNSGGADAVIYEIDDLTLRPELELLQKYGFLRLVKEGLRAIENAEDIIRLTETVDIIEGGDIYMKVKLMNQEFSFTESQLMSGGTLTRYLLRVGKFIRVPQKTGVK